MVATTLQRRGEGGLQLSGTIALFALLQFVILFPILPSRLHIREGDIASQSIRAPRAFMFNSEVLRRQLQQRAIDSVQPVLAYDASIKNQQLAKLSDMLGRIAALRNDSALSRPALVEALATRAPSLTLTQRQTVAAFTADEWRTTSDESFRLLGNVLEERFAEGEQTSLLASVPNRVSTGITAAQGDIAATLVRNLVIPTETINATATQAAKDQASAAIGPQAVSYAKNQVIVRDGDVIDAAKREALQNAGFLTRRLNLHELGAVALIALAMSALLTALVRGFAPIVLSSWSRLALLAVLLGGMLVLARLYMPVVLPDSKRQFLQFAFPAAAMPMLAASLFDVKFGAALAGVAALGVTFTALYLSDIASVVGLTGLQPLEMCMAFFLAGVAGALTVNRAERVSRFLVAGVAVALATALPLFGFWLLEPSHGASDAGWLLAASGLNGVVTFLLAVGTFVLLGSVFNVTTRLQLMELAQLNQPLLRRLQDEAPGTFHHSILVGNLAERAADLIGADALLVRVGSYYHDIGKLSRPGFFVENQLNGVNPHDDLDPQASNRIVQEHVRYGAELARRARLPERVQAFTVEHHGTRLVAFFYRKAAQQNPEIDESIFTYPGPRPQSKETAIAMLADSTEAVVRSSADHSAPHIAELVEGVIGERLAEGQFDDCDLTLRDLRTIAESFKVTLRAIYHPRIEYPAPSVNEDRKRRKRAQVVESPAPFASADLGGAEPHPDLEPEVRAADDQERTVLVGTTTDHVEVESALAGVQAHQNG